MTPFLDSIESATGELVSIQQQLADLTEVDDSLNRLRHQYEEIDKMEAAQAERRRDLHLTGVSADHPRKVLDTLNSMFGAIVAGMDLPNATGHARIDADKLLPIVDEQQFEGRGGGARSAVAVAYSLALLNYALANETALLPGLLMIDSPQKNFGANDDDQELAHRVYERFLETRAGSDTPFQVVIVDNHISPDISDKIKIHEFSRSDGFIKNVPNLFARHDDSRSGGV